MRALVVALLVVAACSKPDEPPAPTSAKGETCSKTPDCADGLACVKAKCIDKADYQAEFDARIAEAKNFDDRMKADHKSGKDVSSIDADGFESEMAKAIAIVREAQDVGVEIVIPPGWEGTVEGRLAN